MLYFYLCKICGNLILKIEDSGNTPACCGQSMQKLVPASTDGALEKHVPVKILENESEDRIAVHVSIGSTPHPMETAHFIQWVALETDQGIQLKRLHPGDDPKVTFWIESYEQVIAVYAYCNLHGLWTA